MTLVRLLVLALLLGPMPLLAATADEEFDDYRKIFAMYQGLSMLEAIADRAGQKNLTALERSQLSKRMGRAPSIPNAVRYVRRYLKPEMNPVTGEVIDPFGNRIEFTEPSDTEAHRYD